MQGNTRTVCVAACALWLPLCIAAVAVGALLASPSMWRAYVPCDVRVCDTGAQPTTTDTDDGHRWTAATCDDSAHVLLRLPAGDAAPGVFRASLCDPNATYVSELVPASPGLNSTRARVYAVPGDDATVHAAYGTRMSLTAFYWAAGVVAALALTGALPVVFTCPTTSDLPTEAARQWRRVVACAFAAALLTGAAASTTTLFASTMLVPLDGRMCEVATCAVMERAPVRWDAHYASCGPVSRALVIGEQPLRTGDVVRASLCAYGSEVFPPVKNERVFYEVPAHVPVNDDGVPMHEPILLGHGDSTLRWTMGLTTAFLSAFVGLVAVLSITVCKGTDSTGSRELEYTLTHGKTSAEQAEEDAAIARMAELRGLCTGGPLVDGDDSDDDAEARCDVTVAVTRNGTVVRFDANVTVGELCNEERVLRVLAERVRGSAAEPAEAGNAAGSRAWVLPSKEDV